MKHLWTFRIFVFVCHEQQAAVKVIIRKILWLKTRWIHYDETVNTVS